MSTLTPVTSIAGAGLLPNPSADVGTALVTPGGLTQAVSNVNNFTTIKSLRTLWNTLIPLVYDNTTPSLSQSVLSSLVTLGANNFPAVTGVIPGPTGPNNPTTVTVSGIISTYDAANQYTAGDCVFYNSIVYLAIKDSQNKTPGLTASADYWVMAVQLYNYPNTILLNVNTIMGNGDLTLFCQAFSGADGYVTQSNSTINSVNNSALMAATFNQSTGGMNTLTTGGLNQVSNNLQSLSADLVNLGTLINLGRLSFLGLPSELILQIGRAAGGVPAAITTDLLEGPGRLEGVTSKQIQTIAAGNSALDAQGEKNLYTAFTRITGNTLTQILALLKIKTAGITKLSDLLDLRYLLPRSYRSLVCSSGSALLNIYTANDTVNTALIPIVTNTSVSNYTGRASISSYQTLKFIIPTDSALAIKSFVYSLQQIKNIENVNFVNFAKSMALIETNQDLTAINNLSTPVPNSVTASYKVGLGQGSGPNGTMLITDIIGMVANTSFATGLANVSSTLSTLNVSNVANIITDMQSTANGDYGPLIGGPIIIPSGPAAGTYTDGNDAFTTGLIPAANNAIANLAASSAAAATSTNAILGNITTEIQREVSNQELAQLNFGILADGGSSPSSALSFASSLHDYGKTDGPGTAKDLLTKLANPGSLSGQAIIASFREGKNIAALESAGITTTSTLSADPATTADITGNLGVTIAAVTTQPPPAVVTTGNNSSGGSTVPATLTPWSQTSSNWSKAATLVAADRNWGILRSYNGATVAGWGFDGTPNQSGTVSLSNGGSNVDIVIVDGVIDPAHPEFAVKADGTGGSRVKYYNWYAANIAGDPNFGKSYSPPITTTAPDSADDSRHAVFVAGVAAGNTQGWAPNANIYNLSPQYVTGGVGYLYIYQYILAWHQKKRAQGNTNPSIVNNSWYSRYTIPYGSITSVTWRGTTYAGPFTIAQLNGYGITVTSSGTCIVALRNDTMDAQIQSCIDAGIIMVGSAGNNSTRISQPGDVDYNNTLTAPGYNSGNPIYYARGSSPVATPNTICVGAIRSGVNPQDGKANFSNTGPRIDIWAPGAYITSSWLTSSPPTGTGYPNPVPDPRNPAYYIAKYSGTSFAAPQITGILALKLARSPDTKQAAAMSYIKASAKSGQIPDSNGGYTDLYSLQGAPNKYAAVSPELKSQ